MKVTVHDSIADIAANDWNQLAGTACPFLRHEFLNLAERTHCVSPSQGWTPRHLSIGKKGRLRAAMPLYEKSHSWGEFVFDWAWARAYEQAGFSYYPKLVSAAPFTPAPGRRLLLSDPDDAEAAQALISAAIALATESDCSSFHILFPTAEEIPLLESAGLLVRKDCQFHWHNRGYGNFDDFLATFNAAKRKKAKRDRRRAEENGIGFRRLKGSDMDDSAWSVVYALISRTFMRRGSLPYFNETFFRSISEQLPENILIVLAEKESRPVAAAVFFESDQVLYGRYWGSDGHYDALHFETCYYQGIDYCIDTGKQVFEPGTQGEHKISRGFSPQPTWSAHWLAHPEFADAIGKYLDEEARHVDRYMDAVDSRSPYKNSYEQ
ncbi:MAG: GNAT family N-acetyltransferase [Gammaproteobacteria bacterium]|nr:GNAT family N-acetyltransferase [Gammaproteobacteria bacterium]MBT8111017.1 GNAT family N-acetyltransferase [Gammaproteobacteria bacterium]NND48453.1 N-acetyltransferase [Woeseiaceae bacterium]NNL45715.1 N-acetyltransferase [Woeseiaceae bacterium]